jgi:hypothetical protein
LLYAESDDGIHWRKPITGYVQDAMETNIVIPNGYSLTLALDPHEPDENKRYKGLFTSFKPGSQDGDTVMSVTSKDGIHWNIGQERPVFGWFGSRLDDVLILNYDPFGRIFILNTRHYEMYAVHRNLKNPVVGQFTPTYYPLDWTRMNKRRNSQAESADCVHWSDPYPIVPLVDG